MPRPAKLQLPDKHHPISQRIVRYLNDEFKGNVRAASEAIGCKYHHLYHIATARVTRPNAECLRLLVLYSRFPTDWWLYGDDG